MKKRKTKRIAQICSQYDKGRWQRLTNLFGLDMMLAFQNWLEITIPAARANPLTHIDNSKMSIIFRLWHKTEGAHSVCFQCKSSVEFVVIWRQDALLVSRSDMNVGRWRMHRIFNQKSLLWTPPGTKRSNDWTIKKRRPRKACVRSVKQRWKNIFNFIDYQDNQQYEFIVRLFEYRRPSAAPNIPFKFCRNLALMSSIYHSSITRTR